MQNLTPSFATKMLRSGEPPVDKLYRKILIVMATYSGNKCFLNNFPTSILHNLIFENTQPTQQRIIHFQ